MFAPTICLALRTAEVLVDELLLQRRRLELFVMASQTPHLVSVEPVAETLTVQGVRLAVDTHVVEGRRARRVDAAHLERQPAAVARRVAEELHVVARAAKRGDVLTVL